MIHNHAKLGSRTPMHLCSAMEPRFMRTKQPYRVKGFSKLHLITFVHLQTGDTPIFQYQTSQQTNPIWYF